MEYTPAQGVAAQMSHDNSLHPEPSTTIDLLDLGTVHRLGFGAMRMVGDGVWGELGAAGVVLDDNTFVELEAAR